MMGHIIPHAFDEFYGIVFIVMILCLPCDMHARLTLEARIMVEPLICQMIGNNTLWLIAHRDYMISPTACK